MSQATINYYRNPKNPDEVIGSTLTVDEAADICSKMSSSFAQSLAKQYRERKGLSPAQLFWLFKLAKPPEFIQLESNLQEFCSVVQTLQFQFPDHGKIVFRTHPDGISVLSGEHFCGRIVGDRFNYTNGCQEIIKQQVYLFSFAPMRFMEEYGKATGRCCVCGRELTNEESVNLGIGPICREKWG